MIEQKVTIGNICFIQGLTSVRVLLLERSKNPMKGRCTGLGGKTEFSEGRAIHDMNGNVLEEKIVSSTLKIEK